MFSSGENFVISEGHLLYFLPWTWIFKETKGFPKSKGAHPLSPVMLKGKQVILIVLRFPLTLLLQGCYRNGSYSHHWTLLLGCPCWSAFLHVHSFPPLDFTFTKFCRFHPHACMFSHYPKAPAPSSQLGLPTFAAHTLLPAIETHAEPTSYPHLHDEVPYEHPFCVFC